MAKRKTPIDCLKCGKKMIESKDICMYFNTGVGPDIPIGYYCCSCLEEEYKTSVN